MKPDRLHARPAREEALILLAISRAASFDERPEAVARDEPASLVDAEFDWGKFLALARRHNSVAAAYRFTVDSGLDGYVPADTMRAMKLGYALAQATYLKNLLELRELAGGLQRDGIPALVIKGIPLASTLYNEPAVRVSRDIDLLCKMEDLERVGRLVEENGYSLHQGRLRDEGYRRYHYHLVYARGAGNESVVEVHWNVRHPGKGVHIDVAPLFRHAKMVDIAGVEVATLDEPHAVWQLAVNLSYSGFLDARDLGDLGRLGRRVGGEDWKALVEFSRKTGTFNEFSTALAVAERTFGGFIPDAFRTDARPRFYVRSMLLPPYTPKTVAWRWIPCKSTQRLTVNLFMREGLRRKIHYLYRIVFPDRASLIETRSARPAPKRWTETLLLYSSGLWIAAKILALCALLGPLMKTGFLADRWADPERHVDLQRSPRGVELDSL